MASRLPPRATILAESHALRVGERRGVGQHDQGVAIDAIRREKRLVQQVERHARLDERVIHARGMVARPLLVRLAAVERARLLGREHRHAGERLGVPQVPLVPVVPRVDALDDGQPATVVEHARELGEPGAHAVRRAVGDEHAHLGLALDRILPAVRLLDAHAEDAADGPHAHRRAVLLRAAAVGPWHGEAPARLVVGELDGRALAGRLHVRRTVRDEAGLGVEASHVGVPAHPELRQASAPPEDVGTPGGVLGIVAARELATGGGAKVRATVLAPAHAAARPSIAEDPIHLVARDDLAVDRRHEFEVVRAERAGDPQVGVRPVPPRAPLGIDGYPVGMGLPDLVSRRVRVGARDDVHPERATALQQIAERIGLLQPRAPVVERYVGRIVRHDAARAQARGIGMHATEVVEPELQIEPTGIVLDERQLRPSHRPIAPGRSGGR